MTVHKKFLLSNGVLVLLIWSTWFSVTFPGSIQIIQDNWPITLTMVFGSFIAGATSEGGGAIAFPVFTKILHISPLDAKIFSLAIQSIGMVAATITIVILRISVEWRVILWASMGGIAGVYLGSAWVAPYLEPGLLKMLFTTLVVSFAFTFVLLNWQQRLYNERLPKIRWQEKAMLITTGFVGGVMTGLVGNGIDIICFSVMVLLFRLSEKVATATSVILMAINSVVGFAMHYYWIGGFTTLVKTYWLSAIPVVIIGAPLGAYFCSRLTNKTIELILVTLILIEFISSLNLIPLTDRIIQVCIVVLLLFSFIYYRMFKINWYRPVKKGD